MVIRSSGLRREVILEVHFNEKCEIVDDCRHQRSINKTRGVCSKAMYRGGRNC
jgi:hypothetical protein